MVIFIIPGDQQIWYGCKWVFVRMWKRKQGRDKNWISPLGKCVSYSPVPSLQYASQSPVYNSPRCRAGCAEVFVLSSKQHLEPEGPVLTGSLQSGFEYLHHSLLNTVKKKSARGMAYISISDVDLFCILYSLNENLFSVQVFNVSLKCYGIQTCGHFQRFCHGVWLLLEVNCNCGLLFYFINKIY